MEFVRRLRDRNGAEADGELPALEDDPEMAVRDEDRQLIGQEMVPVSSTRHRPLTTKGDESGKGVGSSDGRRDSVRPGQGFHVEESFLQTPERGDGKGSRAVRVAISTPVSGPEQGKGAHGPVVTPHHGSVGNGMIGDEENEFWSSQRHPGGPPVAYGPSPDDHRPPLFDQQQLQRLQQLQMQASWIYQAPRPSGEYIPYVPRPEALELEEMKRSHEELKRKHEREVEALRNEVLKLKKEKDVSGEIPKFSTPDEHEQRSRREAREPSFEEKTEKGRGSGVGKEDPTTIQVMMKLMEGMQAMQQRMLDDREDDRAGSVESVQGYIQPLPELCEWNPSTGPIDLGDWLSLIEPIMSDLSKTSGDWWQLLMTEATAWYDEHQQLAPLKRIHHDPKPSSKLSQQKWCRLEKRASTMLLRALPQSSREEMVSTKKLNALGIICQLLKSYQPGGLGEKELVLKSLETPTEASSLGEAVQGLRQWTRWRRRALELQINEPDPFLLLKGLNRLIRKPLEVHRDLAFRINLARSTLQVDATPTSASVTSFASHLLAECEQIAHQEVPTKRKEKQEERLKAVRAKKMLEEEKGSGKGKDGGKEGGEKDKGGSFPCRYFLTDFGCKKGKECKFSHELRDEKKRCFSCGGLDHYSNNCPRSRSSGDGSSKQKGVRIEGEENQSGGSKEPTNSESGEEGNAMKMLLEEANRMLKTLTVQEVEKTGEQPLSNGHVSRATTYRSQERSRDDVVDKLQRQIDELRQKTLRLSRMACNEFQGLLDSGATHPLRPLRPEDDMSQLSQVSVTLADGGSVKLLMNSAGTMLVERADVEPIVPIGCLASVLGCKLTWEAERVVVQHPSRGFLPISCKEGCPLIPRKLALELIREIEESKRGVVLKRFGLEKESKWLVDLVNSHPVLRKLPRHIRSCLAVCPGEWNQLPGNKRLRKRWKRDGLVVHLYAGGDHGFTLGKGIQQLGGNHEDILEIDKLRGDDQNMLSDSGIYSALLRVALEGKLKALVGGPNCRTRSVLRHYEIESQPDAPRPVRSWNGGEYGKNDLTQKEVLQVQEDDQLMWRMIFLFMVAEYVRVALEISNPVRLGLEQPASPCKYMPDTVSWWETSDWKALKKEFGLEEWTYNQGDAGGKAVKPTTFGGNLQLELPKTSGCGVSREKAPHMKSSDLSRWSTGTMTMVAKALMDQVFPYVARVSAISWEEHLAFEHVPYRRDCLVCQECQQKEKPHRRLRFPKGGTLSLDTAGPLVVAPDAVGTAKFLLVGAFTWAVPKGSTKLDEEVVEVEEGDEEAVLEIEEEVREEGKKRGRGRPRKDDLREERDRMSEEEWRLFEEQLEKEKTQQEEKIFEDEDEDEEMKEVEGKNAEEKEEPQEFEVKVFRLVLPLSSKAAPEIMKGALEFILRLRMDGYYVNQVHTDQGGEFGPQLRGWLRNRGVTMTRTPGDSPQSNGRAEVAVQTIKAHIRRVLRAAEVDVSWWPWAARYVGEVIRCIRVGEKPSFPQFLQKVLTRKRMWRSQDLEPTTETVQYLCPAWEEHGHWIIRDGARPTVTRYVLKKCNGPPEESLWIALERELLDGLTVRRRIRGKTTVRSFEVHCQEEQGEKEEDDGESRRVKRMKAVKVLEEEVDRMVFDDPDMLAAEAPVLVKLRKAAQAEDEEDEVLQTRVVSMVEAAKEWEKWIPATEAEVGSLLNEKEALKPMEKDEVEKLIREAHQQGRRVQMIPSKVVLTKKPGKNGGKRKLRWVVCGNYEEKSSKESTYAGGCDATAFRLAIHLSSTNQWEASTVDVRTAFLNAKMEIDDGEDLMLVKPPSFLVERGFMSRTTFYYPLKAVYGFRRSPRLWGLLRDETLSEMRFEAEIGGSLRRLRMRPLNSEPNLWKIEEEDDLIDTRKEIYGLVMSYVDDLFITGTSRVVTSVLSVVRETWSTSEPDQVGLKPIKFLGMDVSKAFDEELQREVWFLSQESYIQDMLDHENVCPRIIPMSKEQSCFPEEEGVTEEKVRAAQKEVGELLWLVCRCRPDLMFSTARLGSNVLSSPSKVVEVSKQVKGYLLTTKKEALKFAGRKDEVATVNAYSDASFAPYGDVSHGCIVVMVQDSPIFWRSGKQSMVTLSTAESELLELIEALTGGESVGVMVEELQHPVERMAWCDSQSAISVVSSEGGSWRTRHLRLRSMFARQSVLNGRWTINHLPGLRMIADMGTKPLSSSRLKELRRLLGMEEIPERHHEDDVMVEKEEFRGRELETMENAEGSLQSLRGVSVLEAERILRLITLAASLQAVKGEEEKEEDLSYQEENFFRLVVGAYTILVILAFALIQWCWRCIKKEKVVEDDQEGKVRRVEGEVRRVEGEVRRVEGEVRRVEGEVRRVEGEVRRAEGEVTKVKGEKEEPFTKVIFQSVPLHTTSSTSNGPQLLVSPEVHRSAVSGGDDPLVCHGQGLHHELPQENVPEPRESELPISGGDVPPKLSIVQEWEQIMEEEALVRREVAAGLPHTRGIFDDESPVANENAASSMTLNYGSPSPTPQTFVLAPEVWITQHGRVYHVDQLCRHLQSRQTNRFWKSTICVQCLEVLRSRGTPYVQGGRIVISSFGSPYHVQNGCPLGSAVSAFPICATCG